MAINLRSTATVHSNGVKILTYGLSGVGKTHLIQTLPNPVIISAEGGLLSLKGADIPYIEVSDVAGVHEAYRWLTESEEATKFDSVALDSISEIAEVVLSTEKKRSKDGRAAYGETNDVMGELIRAFRDLPRKNVYFSAKAEKMQDETGRILYAPSMPGKTLSQGLPYYFDLCLALRMDKDADGNTVRALMCETDGLWMAKNRGGSLEPWEAPDLGAIIAKVSA